MEEENEEAEFIFNRIQGEMADAITLEEVERVTRQDITLQAVMEDIKVLDSKVFRFLLAIQTVELSHRSLLSHS